MKRGNGNNVPDVLGEMVPSPPIAIWGVSDPSHRARHALVLVRPAGPAIGRNDAMLPTSSVVQISPSRRVIVKRDRSSIEVSIAQTVSGAGLGPGSPQQR